MSAISSTSESATISTSMIRMNIVAGCHRRRRGAGWDMPSLTDLDGGGWTLIREVKMSNGSSKIVAAICGSGIQPRLWFRLLFGRYAADPVDEA